MLDFVPDCFFKMPCPDTVRRVHVLCFQGVASPSQLAQRLVEEVAEVFKAVFGDAATAMRGVKALGARNQSCLQSGPWVESDMNPKAESQSCSIASCDVDGEARQA